MNTFCPNLSNKKVKQEFDELKNLFGEDIAYFLWDKNSGYSLDMAPNGANSILFQSLLNTTKDRNKALKAKAKTYFSEFTNWFGDWINDPKNSSKIVDENGEPLVVYHGSKDNSFTVFDNTKNDEGYKGFFFTDDVDMASTYGKNSRGFFINSRDPYIVEGNGKNWNDLSVPVTAIAKDKLDAIRLFKNNLSLQLKEGKITQEIYDFWNGKYFKLYNKYLTLGTSFIDRIKKFAILNKLSKFHGEGGFLKSTRNTEKILELDSEDTNIIFKSITDYGPVFNPKAALKLLNEVSANVYVVGNKYNIKSATDNDGNFSRTNGNIYAFIGKSARAKFEQHLRKQRPDMSEEDIRTTLDFLHSLADNKENTAYIKAAIKWVSSNSITLPQDNEKVRQAFDYARARHIDVQKYRTFGEFISSPEMTKKKTKEKPSFNPDEAKAFHNKHTVTTTGGRVFTVYDIEDNEKGLEDVCKAVAAHYPASPWCLSTFTATGKPTNSAATYWDTYGAIPKKIAYEDGKPVAFSADSVSHNSVSVQFRGITAEAIDTVLASGSHFITATIQSSDISSEIADKLVAEGAIIEGPFDEYIVTSKYLKEIEDQIKNAPRESWWDLEDTHPQRSLTDDIVNTFKYDETLHILDEEEAEIDDDLAQAFVEEAPLSDPSPLVTPEGRIYGFVDDFGNMFLDEERISTEHPIHEYTHLWDKAIQKTNPKLWEKGVELMKQLPLWDDILNDPGYGQNWQSMGISGGELDNRIASEVHARLVGERGVDILKKLAEAKKTSSKIVPKIKKWLLDVWKSLAELFGSKTKDDLSKFTLEDFNNMTIGDLVKGYNPNTGETVFTDANPEELTDTNTLVQHLKNIGIPVCNKEDMEYQLAFGERDYIHNIQQFRELSSRQDVNDQLEQTESVDKVYGYIKENIDPIFNGSYYDYIKANGKNAYDNLKSEITANFNKKFKHWKIKLGPNKEHQLKATITRGFSEDKKDVERWKQIIFNNAQNSNIIDQQDLGHVINALMEQANGMSVHMSMVTKLIAQSLKDKNVLFCIRGYSFDKGQAAKCVAEGNGIYKIYINEDALFVNTSDFSNRVTQTILHELIHVVTESALRNDENLQKEAEALLKEVRTALGKEAKDYGLKDIYEFFAELSNQEFVEKLKSIDYKTGERTVNLFGISSDFKNWRNKDGHYTVKVWQTLFDKVKEFANKLTRAIVTRLLKESENYPNTAYEEATRLFIESIFSADAHCSDKDGVTYTYAAAAATSTDIQSQINDQLGILLNSYKRNQNESESAKQRQNRVFETINKIKMMSEAECIQEVLTMANDELGSFDNDIDGTLIKYLKDQRAKKNPYEDIDSNELIQMYKNTIVFYDNMVNGVLSTLNINNNVNQMTRDLLNKVRSNVLDAREMWKEALTVVTDKLVDKWVNEDIIVDDAIGNNPTEVIKDYLHKNIFYGDINQVQKYIYSLGSAESPLIKLTFNQIQKAETRTYEEADKMCVKLAKAYRKVDRLTRANPFWQKMFMEFDRDGIPTGRFVQPINYGQYELDLNDFVEKLNQQFDADYGFHYIIDNITGEYINSKTMERADEEEWLPETSPVIDQIPPHVEYQLAIQEYKCNHANLRFKLDYYKQRLGRPFDRNIDPDEVSIDYLETHHGLSPKTLRKYNSIQANINHYLNECRDEATGKTYPERLTDPNSQAKLDAWYEELAKLSNAYYEDGTEKTGDDLQIAYELKAWQRWYNNKTDKAVDYDSFEKELAQYDDAINATTPGTEENRAAKNAKAIFLKYNADVAINPKLLEMFFGESKNLDAIESKQALVARIQRSMLKTVVSGDMLVPNLKLVANNIRFFIDCKNSDQTIEDCGQRGDMLRDYNFDDYIEMSPVLYTNANGEYLDNDLNPTSDPDEAITFQEFLIQQYTELALNQQQVAGLMENGAPKDFTGMSRIQIQDYFEELFTYEHKGTRKPLSIFSYMNPLKNIVIGPDGKAFKSIIYKPKGRFAETSSNEYMNPNYNKSDRHIEQPLASFYDNSKAWGEVQNNEDTRNLYDLMIQYMKQAQSDMGFENNQFDYKLPKVQSSSSIPFFDFYRNAKYSIKDSGWAKGLGQAVAKQYFDYNANDADLRSDTTIGPDQSVNQTIPNKYIGTLADRYKYSYDVIQSVIKYAGASIEYKYKNAILSDLQAIRYAQDSANRSSDAVDTPHNREMYDYMMDAYMYKTNKTDTKWDRLVKGFISVGTWKMLGMNVLSALGGMLDSMASILRDGLVGRYYSFSDMLRASVYNTITIPQNIFNYGNPVPNTKLGAFRHMFGFGKTTSEVGSQIGKNKLQNLIGHSMLGIYNIVDFGANNQMLRSMLTSFRFYDGGVVPTGFYRLYDLQHAFMKEGRSKKEAYWAHVKAANETLWGAYKYRNGELYVNPKYESYVTTKIKNQLRNVLVNRSSVNNGVKPSDGSPLYSTTKIGRIIGAMRGWMISVSQEAFAGRDDVTVRKYEKIVKESVKNGRARQKIKYKRLSRTTKEKEQRMSWNFGMGLPQPEILKAFFRSLGVYWHAFAYIATLGRHKARAFSESELFAMKTLFMSMGVALAMINGYSYLDDWCSDVRPVNLAKEKPYSTEEFMDAKLYKELIRNAYIRTTNSRLQQLLIPIAPFDIVKNATTMVSASKSMVTGPLNTLAFGERADMLPETSDNQKIIRRGKYRGYTKWESTWLKAAGPVNNIYSFDTYNGVSANTLYYSREFAWWLKAIGREYSPQKMNKTKHSSRSRSSNPDDFVSPDDVGGMDNFSSPDDNFNAPF